ncbi:hypothetical protein GM658_05955 [Pseudoduganella eburnea]|uniref:DUF4253 domain-containing protein n=1 Tax=Massilia eburnea TaxID=1776165 RepID=A0A6L6QDG0_9BURK|nr:hypothetical protein [Massilia eburnea]MTW10141.1 hypothetical protein [Massilia eburnea]
MKVRNLEVSDTGNELICNGLLITEIEAFEQLVNLVDEYAEKFPKSSILVSLDDLGQAQYTSMHSTMFHNLDDVEGHDLSNVSTSAFENGEHVGFLSTTSEFFIREDNFKSKSADATFDDACARGLDLEDDELEFLERVHSSPRELLDKRVVLWIVPIKTSATALAACPNGYFSSDLSPFENHALAEHLNAKYGYQLFGIGASCIGFRRHSPLSPGHAESLVRDIARLYDCEKNESKIERIQGLVERHKFLFLKYVESLNL